MLPPGAQVDPAEETAEPVDNAMEDAAEPATPAGASVPSEASERALVTRFDNLVQAPPWLVSSFKQMGDDRDFVSEDAMLIASQDTVAVNHVLRNQEVSLALTFPSMPEVSVVPEEEVGNNVHPMIDVFAETGEKFVNKMFKRMHLQKVFEGGMQDAMTVGIAWFKVSLQEDFMKDPLGMPRFNDQQDNVLQYQRLQAQFSNGDFTEEDSRFAEMKALEDTLRQFLITKNADSLLSQPPIMNPSMGPDGQVIMMPAPDARADRVAQLQDPNHTLDLTILPEVERYMCFNMDSVQPEDIRWDWNITKPEDFRRGDWIAHRVFMSDEEIVEQLGVSKDDLHNADMYDSSTGAKRSSPGGDTSTDPSRRDNVEIDQVNYRRAVWEMWHKRHGRVYVWVSGLKTFARNYVPEVTWDEFFPFFPLYYHRVTGKALPLSDTTLQRDLQDEYNTLRSHDREARRSAYPVLFVTPGLLTTKEKAAYESRVPFSVIECQKAGELSQAFTETSQLKYDQQLYSTSSCERDLQLMAGIPSQAAGQTSGGDALATDIAIANDRLNQANDRRKAIIDRVLTDIGQAILEMGLKAFPEDYVKILVGNEAYWPPLDARSIMTNIRVEVKAGSTGNPDRQRELELWTKFSSIARDLGLPINGMEVLKQILSAMRMHVNVNKFILPPMPLAPPGMMGSGQAPGGIPGQTPNGAPPGIMNAGNPMPAPKTSARPHPPKEGVPTAQGGSPPMSTRSMTLGSVPNHG